MDFKGKNLCYRRKSLTIKPPKIIVSDRKFLIDFIITTYLGPDVKSDNPKCSSLQRLFSGLPPYSSNDLGSSFVAIPLLEKLYYYLLRNTLPELVLDVDMFHLYLKGKLDLPNSEFSEGCQQFTNIFPLNLHPQIWFPDSFRVVKGVVLIDDPLVSLCVKDEDLDRFRSLTGVSTFKLDLSECLRVPIHPRLSKESDNDNDNDNDSGCVNNEGSQSEKFQPECTRKYSSEDTPSMSECTRKYASEDTPSMSEFPNNASGDPSYNKMCDSDGPSMMPLISLPHVDDCVRDCSVVLTGTANRGILGPSIGVLDIGISKAAYLFRVSLPGVKREYNQFSCDIESDGKVEIRGMLSGGRTIEKQSRIFQMKTQQLCSPGPFTVSFNLPGPVDPRLFAPNFRTDGIFEGVVIKL
ncbi:increased DNA methylation 3 [Vicia villosa]|uniref:increased DNA methylation 3 n=1 Tax=Vicia villosa TaxID=3911 RepID=UPI00273A9212|nr:increased DNA methylation 3 [Vicia villosa]XP_058773799.1 increased DNA methylation 3 [Vicia villosa]